MNEKQIHDAYFRTALREFLEFAVDLEKEFKENKMHLTFDDLHFAWEQKQKRAEEERAKAYALKEDVADVLNTTPESTQVKNLIAQFYIKRK
jgi:hypothetical protein